MPENMIRKQEKIVNSETLTRQPYLDFEYYKNSSNTSENEVNDIRGVKLDLLNSQKVVNNEIEFDKNYVELQVSQAGYKNNLEKISLDLGDLLELSKSIDKILEDTGYVLPDDHYKVAIDAEDFSLTYDELIIYDKDMFIEKSGLKVYYENINKPFGEYEIHDLQLDTIKNEAIEQGGVMDLLVEVNITANINTPREVSKTVAVTIIGKDSQMILPEI